MYSTALGCVSQGLGLDHLPAPSRTRDAVSQVLTVSLGFILTSDDKQILDLAAILFGMDAGLDLFPHYFVPSLISIRQSPQISQ